MFKRYFILWLVGLLGACRGQATIDVSSNELVTSESGKSVKVTIELLEPPRGALVVRAVSTNIAEATVSAPLLFDAQNWQTPQTLVVTGVDDATPDGDVAYQIIVEVERRTFGQYRARTVEVLSGVNLDNDGARFDGLGDLPGGAAASYATAVSPTGDIVVGWSVTGNGDEAFRWTREFGIQGLGGDQSRANNISSNGQMIVGSVAEASYEKGRAAAVWRGDSPIQVIPPYSVGNGGPILFYPVDATVALNIGDFFGACIQKGAYGERLICRVTAGGDFAIAGPGDVFAGDDAGHLVGTRYPERHAGGVIGPRGYENLLNTALDYPVSSECVIPHQCSAIARAFTADPVTIVGTALVPPKGQTSQNSPLINIGFVVTEGEGVTRLRDLSGGTDDSGAYAIDASGQVIGGFGTNASGKHAVVWFDRIARPLADIVSSQGGAVPDGWHLEEIRAMSQDGLTFVGNGTNPDGKPEAFVVVLASPL